VNWVNYCYWALGVVPSLTTFVSIDLCLLHLGLCCWRQTSSVRFFEQIASLDLEVPSSASDSSSVVDVVICLIQGEGSHQGVVIFVNSLSLGYILGHSTARVATVSHPRGGCLIGLLNALQVTRLKCSNVCSNSSVGSLTS